MKRYQEKYIKIWKEGTWVVCPECHNAAIITPDGHLVLLSLWIRKEK